MADTSHTTTRRALLGALAIAPIAITAPAVAASSDFDALLASYVQALAKEQAFDRDVASPISDRFYALRDAMPHTTVRWAQNPCFRGEIWSTAQPVQMREARYFLNPTHTAPIQEGHADYHKACLELVAADDTRQANIAQLAIECGFNASVEESDRLLELRCAARDAVITCPVSSAADLARKIGFITEHEQWEWEETQQAISADVARLAA